MKYRFEEKKVGKHTFTIVTSLSFEKWLDTKMTEGEFRKLSLKGKKEIFLNWKWGTSGLEGNEVAEQSEWDFMAIIKEYTQKDWEKMGEEDRDWFQRKLKWNNLCYQIWKSIEDGSFLVGEGIRKVAKQFEGEIGG